jgi:hypothetical protein
MKCKHTHWKNRPTNSMGSTNPYPERPEVPKTPRRLKSQCKNCGLNTTNLRKSCRIRDLRNLVHHCVDHWCRGGPDHHRQTTAPRVSDAHVGSRSAGGLLHEGSGADSDRGLEGNRWGPLNGVGHPELFHAVVVGSLGTVEPPRLRNVINGNPFVIDRNRRTGNLAVIKAAGPLSRIARHETKRNLRQWILWPRRVRRVVVRTADPA